MYLSDIVNWWLRLVWPGSAVSSRWKAQMIASVFCVVFGMDICPCGMQDILFSCPVEVCMVCEWRLPVYCLLWALNWKSVQTSFSNCDCLTAQKSKNWNVFFTFSRENLVVCLWMPDFDIRFSMTCFSWTCSEDVYLPSQEIMLMQITLL